MKHKQGGDNKIRFVCLLTPKAYSKIDSFTFPQDVDIVKFIPCIDIYINVLGGWTEEECDEVAYLISEEKYNCFKNREGVENDFTARPNIIRS